MSEDFFNHLRALKNTDIKTVKPRPAMGWWGLKAAADIDPFIRQKLAEGKFTEVNQTKLLKTHSGMQEPTDTLRSDVYKKEIMDRMLKHTGFGTY